MYVPSCYNVEYDGPTLVAVTPRYPDVPERVEKRTIADLAEWPYPRRQLVPMTEVVHDRLNVEIFRGCTRGCRFCQAGMITRPVRERPAAQVLQMVRDGLRRTGYDEVSLTSLSSADFSGIGDTVRAIVDDGASTGKEPAAPCTQYPISVSLPSLRVDAFTVGVATEIQKVRRTGLTFAPEAGTWRMRQVINKLITEEDLYGAVESAFSQGWRRVKLYFLTGLPTETDEDTLGIADLARNCVAVGRSHHRGASVTASLGGFVPKPQTPFQWFGQDTVSALQRKIGLLRQAVKGDRGVQLRWHDPKASVAEGIASRGDRRIGAVIEEVWRRGGTFQEWSEYFSLDLWTEAMSAHGLSLDWYVHRDRGETEVLPWAHISAGLHSDFLWQEWQDALAAAGTPDCRWTPCYDCGACTGYGIEHVVASHCPAGRGQPGHRSGSEARRRRAGLSAAQTRCRGPVVSAGGPVGGGMAEELGGAVGARGEPGEMPGPAGSGFASGSARSGRSAGPATGTWPACGSGRFVGWGFRSPTAKAFPRVPRSASGWPCPPVTNQWPNTSTSSFVTWVRLMCLRCRPGCPTRSRWAWTRPPLR